MADANSFMAASMATQGLSSIGTSIASADAYRAKAAYEKSIYENNASLAELQGTDALMRGEKEASAHAAKVRKTKGSQLAMLASQGLDVSDGSALDVLTETSNMGALDVLTIRNNATREAFGYKAEAQISRSKGNMEYLTGRSAARSTLLTGGMSALSYGLQSGYYAKKKD